MPDTSFEDRLRSALHDDADAQPFTISAAELERRATARRRDRNGQRLTLMAAGIAAVAIGTLVAFGNGWLRMPSAGGIVPAPVATASPEASAPPESSAPPDASPTLPSPSANGAPSPTPTGESLPCTQLGRTGGAAVPFIAGVTPGDAMGYGSTPTAWGAGSASGGDPTTWEPPDGAMPGPIPAQTTSKLQFLGADQLYCITGVTAEARPENGGEIGATVTLPPVTQAPAATIELAPPAVGTWRIRVTVRYATTVGVAWTTETFLVTVR